jgi:hypothetical protein
LPTSVTRERSSHQPLDAPPADTTPPRPATGSRKINSNFVSRFPALSRITR